MKKIFSHGPTTGSGRDPAGRADGTHRRDARRGVRAPGCAPCRHRVGRQCREPDIEVARASGIGGSHRGTGGGSALGYPGDGGTGSGRGRCHPRGSGLLRGQGQPCHRRTGQPTGSRRDHRGHAPGRLRRSGEQRSRVSDHRGSLLPRLVRRGRQVDPGALCAPGDAPGWPGHVGHPAARRRRGIPGVALGRGAARTCGDAGRCCCGCPRCREVLDGPDPAECTARRCDQP